MKPIVLAAAAAAILWGANFNLSQLVVHEMNPMTAGALRFALAAMIMAAWVFSQGESIPLRRHWKSYLILGTIGIGGFNLLFFMAMQSTSAVNGALIMGLNPLATAALAAFFLGERLGGRQMFAMPVAVLGAAAAVLGGGAQVHLAAGDALMIGANLSWALYNVLCRRLMPTGPSGAANSAGIMIMGAAVMAAGVVLVQAPLIMPSAKAAAALGIMAAGGSALAYLLWNLSLSRLGAARTAVFLNLVPVSAMIFAALSGAPPSPAQLIGGALVVLAVGASAWPVAAKVTVSA